MQYRNKTLVISGILLAALGLVVFQIISGQGATVQASGPEPSIDSGVAWGPSYYADDSLVEPVRNRDELNFMKLIDQTALTGQRLGPSYAADETIVGPHQKMNAVSGITWGPSYYADDTLIEANELDVMKQVDQNALRGVSEGPSYQP